jgi:hypothetical protein
MSNYTKSTNFAVKDGLSAGTAAKRVRGTEIDDEYNAIAVAVATKANINNAALTGIPTAPTASASTNSTQLATTAYTTTAVAAIPTVTAAVINGHAYPVGSIYTSVVATNPATLLGVGVWEAFGAGRVMLGAGGGYTAGATGGATTDSHALSIGQIPSHTHGYTGTYGTADADGSSDRGRPVGASNSYCIVTKLEYQGSGQAHTHDIMQPYIVVYIWKRTS